MSSTPFKSPHPLKKPKRSNSDSEDSTVSESSTGTSYGELSIVVLYDELQRLQQQRIEERDKLHDGFLHFAEQSKLLYHEWASATAECERLRNEIDQRIADETKVNNLLKNARLMLDEEKKKRKWAEQERDDFKFQIAKFCNSLAKDSRNKLADEAREQMSNLYSGRMSLGDPDKLSAIKELNSTGSMLSDFSYSRSEDDLDSPRGQRYSTEWRKPQKRTEKANPPVVKKRKSNSSKVVDIGPSETVRATTTLTVNKEGPITATSVIESVPKVDEDNPTTPKLFTSHYENVKKSILFNDINSNLRQHCFQQRTVVMPILCAVCEKHIRFGKSAHKCKECRLTCHTDCIQLLPIPCVPAMNTPSSKKFTGTIADYTPTTPPMVPTLIVNCINEIEQRGLNELGLYRIPGSEKDVKSLKEKFLTSRVPPNLKDVDIHVICGCIKIFLRSLAEPIVTYNLWNNFITAVNARDLNDINPALYDLISKLPRPNRDTLAFIMLHLQKVSKSPECKMPVNNLAIVFGPTIVGYSSNDTGPDKVRMETKNIVKVTLHLLDIPSDYWSKFTTVYSSNTSRIQQTPSTDSLLRLTSNGFLTPSSKSMSKKRRFFGTPPSYKQ